MKNNDEKTYILLCSGGIFRQLGGIASEHFSGASHQTLNLSLNATNKDYLFVNIILDSLAQISK